MFLSLNYRQFRRNRFHSSFPNGGFILTPSNRTSTPSL